MAVSCGRQVEGLRARGIAVDVLALGAPGITEPRVEIRDGGHADLQVPAENEAGMEANQGWIAVQMRSRKVGGYSHVVGFGAAAGGFHATTFGAWLGIPAAVLVRGNDLDRDWFLPHRGALVREAFARATSIGAVSQEKVKRLQALYPGKFVAWTPNSVDAARWRLLPSDRLRREQIRGLLQCGDGECVIGLFGELKAKKRVPFWLEAIRDAGLLGRIRLLVVGTLDAPTSAILDDAAIAPRSLRLPFCPPDQLAGLYAAADYVAIPSMFEGMPNVLLEAMVCGCVPMVSDAGAMREVVEDGVTGFVFAGDDRECVASAMSRALRQSAEDRAAMSARASDQVAKAFTLDRELDALLALLL